MRFRKATVLVSLCVVCLVLVAQSAKADDIVFNDLTDTYSVTGAVSDVLTVVACGVEPGICTVTLSKPGYTISGTTLLPTFLMAESTSTTAPGTPVSDGLNSLPPGGSVGGVTSLVGASSVVFTFHSDPPPLVTGGPEINLGPCPILQIDLVVGCNVTETGLPQLAGTITWTSGTIVLPTTTDNIIIQSDGVEPEPATLILFGSGLVLAGGFLRRRGQLLTPSVPYL
jgi:hypothetical protein